MRHSQKHAGDSLPAAGGWRAAAAALLLACTFAGCSANRPADDAVPVKEAVVDYLKSVKQVDTDRMEIRISDVEVDGERASCLASFALNGDAAFPPMLYRYTLEKQETGWKVASSEPKTRGGPHPPPGEGAAPHGLIPGHRSDGSLPEGHPPMDAHERPSEGASPKEPSE